MKGAWGSLGHFGHPGAKAIEALLADCGSVDVSYLGELSHANAMARLARAEVLVLPSHTEGFPNVVLEAMALGRAIVATSVGAVPEMLDGGCGLLVPPRDPQRLSSAIRQVLFRPEVARRLAAAGRETIRARFSVERMARLTEEHYIAVLNRSKPRSNNASDRGEARVTAANTREPS